MNGIRLQDNNVDLYDLTLYCQCNKDVQVESWILNMAICMHAFYFIFYLEPYACIHFIYLLFGSCCQDVSSFNSTCQDVSSFSRRAICMHTFYFICQDVSSFSIGEPYIHAYILFHGSCCQDASYFSRGAIYMHSYILFYLSFGSCCQDVQYHLSVAPAKMFYLSVGEPYT